jgi:hypothetical protein
MKYENGNLNVLHWTRRFFHHGVMPLKDGCHPDLGRQRINLTFRRAKMRCTVQAPLFFDEPAMKQ